MPAPSNPSADDATLYMEMVAALISMSGQDEIFIPQTHFPMSEFEIWRRFEQDSEDGPGLIIRLKAADGSANT